MGVSHRGSGAVADLPAGRLRAGARPPDHTSGELGVSQHFKTYADLVIADPRMSPALAPVTAGKPGVLVTVQGGNYSPGTPKEGWDHATAWMRRILEDVWQIDLEVVTREFTPVGVNPALDAFTDMAEELKSNAEQRAHRAGRELAERQLEAASR